MSTYKQIYGYSIKNVVSDPSADEGQVWYNNTSYAIKLSTLSTVGTWAAGGNINTARAHAASSQQGTQTATIIATGFGPGPWTNASESYNGSSWTNTPNVNTARYEAAGSGTGTSALVSGGYNGSATGATEKWNGTSWTSNPTSLNTARHGLGGNGTQTSTLVYGGYGNSTDTESFNGTSWTNAPALATGTSYMGTAGASNTSALAFGGGYSRLTTTQSYNGASWTNLPGGSLNTGRYNLGSFGIQTSAVAAGGNVTGPPSTSGVTELWNGTTWTTNPNSMGTARELSAGAGTQAAGITSGGSPGPPYYNASEEFTGPGVATTKTVTTS